MSKYFAFLRGINISGKNKVPMAELKVGFEELQFSEVSTYLNSGNVAFTAQNEAETVDQITLKIEKMIENKFQLSIPVYVIDEDKLKEIMKNSPEWWGNDDKEKYHNLIFILTKDTPEEICALVGEPSDGLEIISIYENVIFWTFDRKLYQKCNWWKKTAAVGIGEKLTIRTANTIKKML